MRRITKRIRAEAAELIKTVPAVKGEKRVVYMCDECGLLFVRRYVPYSLGFGATWGACSCFLTHFVELIPVLEIPESRKEAGK